jgi:2-polyprenyl-3-methyl-5-hydroxy-6-metoxy-1,4-benzoquinol methylase
MNNAEFSTYKTRIRSAIRQTLRDAPRRSLDEAGFSAYSHPNAIINWLFWQRLHKVISYIELYGPYDCVLDFGFGSGVMLPFLGTVSQEVAAFDIDLGPFKLMNAHIAFPICLKVYDGTTISLDQLSEASFEMIVATDVLEHVKDLPTVLRALVRLLKPGGRLIVSGPTENFFYQIGRRLAGSEYSGEYHERGIAEIKRELAALIPIEQIATLYWPVPLFDLFAAIR